MSGHLFNDSYTMKKNLTRPVADSEIKLIDQLQRVKDPSQKWIWH